MAASIQARTEFASALMQICNERGIDPDVVLDTIKAAILAAYKKDYPDMAELHEEDDTVDFIVNIDSETGATQIFKEENGQKEDVTPPGFGRIAAQTAKQVILQRVREAEKDAIIGEYQDRVGSMVTGMVLRFDGKNVIFDIGRGQGYMPPEDQIRGEYYKMNQRMAIFIKDIRETMRGKSIIVSRSVAELVVELFKREVPEVNSGAVEVKAIAREAGIRTKIAVNSTQSGVDPVGSCVGQKGVRVQEVINEVNNEKIDIIQYSESPSSFIAAALAPAENLDIDIDENSKKAVVTVPDDQMSLAIGRGGQNVRLAAKLTGYKIDIVGSSGKSLSVTGEEEFEIDQLDISKKTRQSLIDAGITHLFELQKMIDEQRELEGVTPAAYKKLIKAVDAFKELTKRPENLLQPETKADEKETETEAKPKAAKKEKKAKKPKKSAK